MTTPVQLIASDSSIILKMKSADPQSAVLFEQMVGESGLAMSKQDGTITVPTSKERLTCDLMVLSQALKFSGINYTLKLA